MRRVVITGMGIYSCIGKNLDEVAKSLYLGKSGIGIDPMRTEYGYRSPLTGIVEEPQQKESWTAVLESVWQKKENMLMWLLPKRLQMPE